MNNFIKLSELGRELRVGDVIQLRGKDGRIEQIQVMKNYAIAWDEKIGWQDYIESDTLVSISSLNLSAGCAEEIKRRFTEKFRKGKFAPDSPSYILMDIIDSLVDPEME